MRKRRNIDYELAPEIVVKVPWFRRRLLAWFTNNQRSFPWRTPGRTPYEVLVAEIMLQRTIAANVAQVYPVFLAKYPSFDSLARATRDELEIVLKPLGLWRLKARVFNTLAKTITERGGTPPATREELESFDNIGRYTANVVLCTIHGHDEPFVDVNMARLLERFFGPRKLADIRDDPYLHTLALAVVRGKDNLLVNWAVLDFSALVCKARRPLCEICPLKARCRFYLEMVEN